MCWRKQQETKPERPHSVESWRVSVQCPTMDPGCESERRWSRWLDQEDPGLYFRMVLL